MHTVIDPAILSFGTPVVLVSSTNVDGSPNLAPMSSAWWVGQSRLLGLGARSLTPANIQRTGECVLDLPSVREVAAVDRLARTTGSDPVPPWKQATGYRHVRDQFACARLTPLPGDHVAPPRVAECPVHLEAVLEAVHPLARRYGLGDEVHPSSLAQIPESAYRAPTRPTRSSVAPTRPAATSGPGART